MSSVVGEWLIVRYWREDSLVVPIASTQPQIEFSADNRVLVKTGCNSVHSTWTLDPGNNISFTAPVQTMMFCAQPEGVMEQESALASALERSTQVEFSSDRLVLLSDAGDVLIEAEDASSDAGEAQTA